MSIDDSHMPVASDWEPDGLYMERSQQGQDDWSHNARFDPPAVAAVDVAEMREANAVSWSTLTAPADQTVGHPQIYGDC